MDSVKQRLANVQAVLKEHKFVWLEKRLGITSGDTAMKLENLAMCDTWTLFQRQTVSTNVLAH